MDWVNEVGGLREGDMGMKGGRCKSGLVQDDEMMDGMGWGGIETN